MRANSHEAVGPPYLERRTVSALMIVLMNIWVPLLMVIDTVIGIVLFPVGLLVWRLVTRWPLARIMRHFIWIYGRVWMWIVSPFVRFRLAGADREWARRPIMYVANHLSFVDIFCLSAMPVFDVVICLRSWPFRMVWFAPFMRLAEYLDLESLPWDEIVARSKGVFSAGRSMLVFPEGHRSRDGRLGRFHSGAFKLALQSSVPIVPICITGTDRISPPARRWLEPSRVSIECLEPIAPEQFEGDLGHIELRRTVKQRMEACLARLSA